MDAPEARSLTEMTIVNSNPLVLKVPFPFLRLRVLVFAQNVFIKLHVRAKKVLEPRFDALSIFQDFFSDVISIDIYANRTYNSEFFSFDRDRGAFEFSRADVQLVVQLFLVQELAAFQINQQVCRAVAQMPPRHVVFKNDQ
jgi:hypothetical protein